MAIDLSTFWGTWDVVSGNTSATNQYEFWKGMVMSTGQVLANQYEFFQYHNTTRYEWFRDLQSTYPEVYDEYTFYRNTNDPQIYDMRTFYEFGAPYLNTVPVTPTPTPTNTPTMTVTPTVTPTNTLTPTPTFTPTPSSTPTGDPDAQAYLAAVVATGGTVTSDITAAVETLFSDLKTAGIYSKLDILMPMVGSTAQSCLINAITPTNDLFKWTAFGTALTYDISGITGNNSGVLRSNFQMSDLTNAVSGSTHFSAYLNRLNTGVTAGYLNGYINTLQSPYTYFNCTNYQGNLYGGLWGDQTFGASNTPVTGFWLRNRTTSSAAAQYVNNSLIQENNGANTVFDTDYTRRIGLFTLYWQFQSANDMYNGEIGNHGYATVTLGGGLTTQERTDLNTIITAFNTALGRA